MGRSAPFYGYNYTNAREVSFTIPLHHDFCIDGIVNTIARLKALVYPDYTSYTIAPKCYINLGAGLRFTGFCKSCDVTWKKPNKYDTYLSADVSLAFDAVIDVPYTAKQIEAGVER
jgi:hypothetical protein